MKKEPWMNEIEYDMNFCTFGLMQISYLFHKDFCGLSSFSDLFAEDINVDCGLKILADCLEGAQEKRKSERLRHCFVRYNGSQEYADEVMSRLADYMIDTGTPEI